MSDHLVLEWLKVERFRHLMKPARLDFADGHTVLVGLNGTGKTNLLLLIDAVAKLNFSRFSEDPEGLKLSFGLRLEEWRLELAIESTGVRERRESKFKGTLRAPGAPDCAFSSADMELQKVASPLESSFAYDLGSALNDPEEGRHPAVALVSGLIDSWDREPPRLDEALGIFRLLTEDDGLKLTLDERQPSNSDVGFTTPANTWVPRSVTSVIRAVPPENRRQAFTTDFLAKAAEACGFAKIELELGSPDERRYARGWVERTYGPFDFYATKGRSRFHHRGFSFGQKRIVAACWHAAAVGRYGVAVTDELVNGLHHSAIAIVLQLIGARQAFFASQNPLLLDLLEFEDKSDLRCRVISCRSTDSGWEWSQPSDAEVDRLFDAYDAGFQHVSELLRDEGLW